MELILDIDPFLKVAYDLKGMYLVFNSTSTIEDAHVNLAEIVKGCSSSSIEGYRRYSTTLIEWSDVIVISSHMYNDRRLSNGKIEATNSRIKTILKNANGFRNFSKMRNRIMFSINKDSLSTSLEKSQTIKQPGKKRGKYHKNK